MAVTCNLNYHGGQYTGVKFTVTSCYQKELAAHGDDKYAKLAVYTVEVELPDGKIFPVPEWKTVKTTADFTKAPLTLAEAAMKARLAEAGATNIQDV
tara:strand:- start:302 stop:592 length:291 start_codon:yes stop_codon:yes gene_type:complete